MPYDPRHIEMLESQLENTKLQLSLKRQILSQLKESNCAKLALIKLKTKNQLKKPPKKSPDYP